jgi:hypothetical protein
MMADDLLAKWLAILRPLACGQFGGARANGMALTCGQFWLRTAGGYNLYRWTGEKYPVDVSEGIVGAAQSGANTISNFPFVTHVAGTRYWYLVRAVGAGGVEEQNELLVARVELDGSGELLGPEPNAPESVCARPVAGGRVELSWRYDPTGQEAEPSVFGVFANAGGTMDWQTPMAEVAYRRGRVNYVWTSGAFEHGARLRLAVRAKSVMGFSERNEATVLVEADALGPAPLAMFVAEHGQEQR